MYETFDKGARANRLEMEEDNHQHADVLDGSWMNRTDHWEEEVVTFFSERDLPFFWMGKEEEIECACLEDEIYE